MMMAEELVAGPDGIMIPLTAESTRAGPMPASAGFCVLAA